MQLNERMYSRALVVLTTLCCPGLAPPATLAQPPSDDAANRAWQRAALDHADKMRRFSDADGGAQPTPAVIPTFETDFDASGSIATTQPGGPTSTAGNPFFQDLGTNGRTCFTCHQPQNGW
jgi:hypothetical protein